MPRLFEWKSQEQGDVDILIDLDKVYLVRVEKQHGQVYPRVHVRFVDGYEEKNAFREEVVQSFLSAYRAYLAEH